jgi:transposase-like protein
MIYIGNIEILTAKSAIYLGNVGPSELADRLKALERENRELRQANEILRKASAYFAQAELDRPFKR